MGEREKRYASETKEWNVISMNWINKWKQFVSGHGELPGPIDNLNLYRPSI